jgi:hypothetical protein
MIQRISVFAKEGDFVDPPAPEKVGIDRSSANSVGRPFWRSWAKWQSERRSAKAALRRLFAELMQNAKTIIRAENNSICG